MGIFTKHKKYNHEVIESTSIEYKDVDVTFKLVEYDLYERILFLRERTHRQGITVTAKEGAYDPFTRNTIATEKLAWNDCRGPSHGLDYQLRHAWNRVRAEIDQYVAKGDELHDAVDGLDI